MNEFAEIAAVLTARYGARLVPPVTVSVEEVERVAFESGEWARVARERHLSRLASRRRFALFRARVTKLARLLKDIGRDDPDVLEYITKHKDMSGFLDEPSSWIAPIEQLSGAAQQKRDDFVAFFASARQMLHSSDIIQARYMSEFSDGKSAHRHQLIIRLAVWWRSKFGCLPPSGRTGPFVRLAAAAWRTAPDLPDIGDVEAKLGSDVERLAKRHRRLDEITEKWRRDNSVSIG